MGKSIQRNPFDPNNVITFSENVGLRIHGGASRWKSPKRSFRIYVRNEYGLSTKIRTQVFPACTLSKFDKLIFKGGFSDAWSYPVYGPWADGMEERQRKEGTYFNIKPLGGQTSKVDRIQRLVPLFDTGRFYLPHRLIYKGQDMIKLLIDNEYSFFPFCVHDDMLDAIARIEDPELKAAFPQKQAAMPEKKARNTRVNDILLGKA